jgi:hypothetical protein
MKDLRNISLVFSMLAAGLAACDPVDNPDDPDDPNNPCPMWYPDVDQDNYGAEGPGERHCFDPLDGRVTNHTDCDDTRDWVNPGELEVCDGVDNDCNDVVEVDCPAGCEPTPLVVGSETKDYLFCTIPVTFADAHATCLQLGYDFVHVNSSVENSALRRALGDLHINYAWIGATDAAEEGKWIWADDESGFWNGTWAGENPWSGVVGTGVPVANTFNAWFPGVIPDNYPWEQWEEDEDCAYLDDGGIWDDTNCGHQRLGFICERKAP